MMSDVLTEMCVLGGCAGNRSITDECKHCGNYKAEIERRRTLPLAEGAGGLKVKRISVEVWTLPATEYVDKRGWRYKVVGGIGKDAYKARYHRPENGLDSGWKCCAKLPWRSTFDEAQADLNGYAAEKGWAKV